MGCPQSSECMETSKQFILVHAFVLHFLVTENISHLFIWQIAKEEEKGVYLNFLNFLINDSIYLLDESLNKILELKEIEAEMANVVEWESRPPQEREERLRVFHQWENVSFLY